VTLANKEAPLRWEKTNRTISLLSHPTTGASEFEPSYAVFTSVHELSSSSLASGPRNDDTTIVGLKFAKNVRLSAENHSLTKGLCESDQRGRLVVCSDHPGFALETTVVRRHIRGRIEPAWVSVSCSQCNTSSLVRLNARKLGSL